MPEQGVVRLGDHIEMLVEFPFKSDCYGSSVDDIRLLRGDNIGQGRLKWGSAKRWPTQDYAKYEAFRVRLGDVVIAMDRPWIEAGLKHATVRSDDTPSLLVQRVARLRAGPSIDQSFLGYLIGGRDFTRYVLSVQTGTAVPHISGSQIKNFTFKLPPLAEQTSIGFVLKAIDDKIEANNTVLSAAQQLAAALLQNAVNVTKNITLALVAKTCKRLSYKGSGLADAGMPMVNLGNAERFGGFKRDGFKHYTGPYQPRHVAHGGDLLVTNTDLTWKLETLGYPMLLPDDVPEALFSQDVSIIDFAPEHAHLRLPVWAHLFTRDARLRVESMAHGTTVAAIPPDALTGMEVPVLERGHPAIGQAGALLQRAWAAERESTALANLRDALLPGLMSGRLRVREAEEAVSEAV